VATPSVSAITVNTVITSTIPMAALSLQPNVTESVNIET
jgi:hypothetical protein